MSDKQPIRWRKSSHSDHQGGNCVEIADLTAWRKSSRSDHQGGQCVEVADLSGDIGVRDSKNPGLAAHAFNRTAFGQLARRIKAGQYDI